MESPCGKDEVKLSFSSIDALAFKVIADVQGNELKIWSALERVLGHS
jgi:hypothetical protein